MEIQRLIELLSQGNVYPAAGDVQVVQTHISVVFLIGDVVYKIKKPVKLGFLDFSTLERRRHFCTEEVRLNRRLAPQVYLGVVPIVRIGEGVRVEGDGEVVEWAVKMVRLPAEATLENKLRRGEVDAALLEKLARQVSQFHARAERSEHIATFGRFENVARNARDNFGETRQDVGVTVNDAVWQRLRTLTEDWLARLEPLITDRAARGIPCDTHGDLHLDHVYMLEGETVIIDCIEFSERFRNSDPVADMAFLVMDLMFHDCHDLAKAFAGAYFAAAQDDEGQRLLPFYTAYRAIVRAKVDGIAALETELPTDARGAARRRSLAHWLLGLNQLESPRRRPALVLVGGLPGTGKSTLARALAERAGFEIIRSDVVRKELAGITADQASQVRLDATCYSPEWSERTYAECEMRASEMLSAGGRVIIDATFRDERQRHRFLEMARELSVPALLFNCRARPEVVRARLAERQNDASDAGWAVYEMAASESAPTPDSCYPVHDIATDGPTAPIDAALAVLTQNGIA